jgi:ATP-dependent RNA helicase DeaD
MNTFDDLGLSNGLLHKITSFGWQDPTPIQNQSIPLILQGDDLIAQAQTGTGKTAAFSLPILDKIDISHDGEPQVLVLTPTRELAGQIAGTFKDFVDQNTKDRICLIYGGQTIKPQFDQLSRNPSIIIGTPGRLIDHLHRGSLNLHHIRIVVIDEADEMLNLGFRAEVELLLSQAKNRRQTLLFSATMPNEINEIAKIHLRDDYQKIVIEGQGRTSDLVKEGYILVKSNERFNLLRTFLELEINDGITLVFARTRRETTQIVDRLQETGHQAEALSGELTQNLREAVVKRLKENRLSIVVATDVAARGLDIEGITLVINYDVPLDSESYVHRIGRTGRAGRAGRAILLVTPREIKALERLENFLERKLEALTPPNKSEVMNSREKRLTMELENLVHQIDSNYDDGFNQKVQNYQTLIQYLEDHSSSIQKIVIAALMLASKDRPLSELDLPPQVNPLDLQELKANHMPLIAAHEGCTILTLDSGKLNGVRPKDIVGAISHEARIDGSKVGAIRIEYTRTLFELPNEYIDQLFEKLTGKPICGRSALFSIWDGQPENYISTEYRHQKKRLNSNHRQYDAQKHFPKVTTR